MPVTVDTKRPGNGVSPKRGDRVKVHYVVRCPVAMVAAALNTAVVFSSPQIDHQRDQRW